MKVDKQGRIMGEMNYKEAYIFAIQRQEMIDYVNKKKKEKEWLDELEQAKRKVHKR